MNEILQYLRDDNNHPYGVMYAFCEGEFYYIGISVCNRKHDKYDKMKGLHIARQRAESQYLNEYLIGCIKKGNIKSLQKYIPSDVIIPFVMFTKRCETYFKDKANMYELYIHNNKKE